MNLTIFKRKLNIGEIDQLIPDIKKVPQLIAGDRKRWQKFDMVYVVYYKSEFIGICAIVTLDNWIKLGPFVILEEHRGKGYGKQLLSQIIKDYHGHNLFIGSATPAVWSIARNNNFTEVSLWKMPYTVQKYLFINTLESCRRGIIGEWTQKLFQKKNKYRCFIKLS